MNEHPNATLMREALEAMNAGQVEAMSQYFADDVAALEVLLSRSLAHWTPSAEG